MRRRSNRSIQIKEARFSTDVVEILEATDEDEVFSIFVKKIQELIQNFNKIGSNWRFQSITSLDMCLAEFKLLGGSCYNKLFPSAEKVVINIKNEEDEECFRWCILRHLTRVEKNPQGISDLRDKVDQLDFSGIEFLMNLKDIGWFKRRNQGSFVNILGYNDEGNKHYFLIKDMSRRLSSQISDHHGQVYFRMRSLNSFNSVEVRSKHIKNCKEHEPVAITVPEEGEKVELNFYRKMPVQFVIMTISNTARRRVKPVKKTHKRVSRMNIRSTNLLDMPLLCKYQNTE